MSPRAGLSADAVVDAALGLVDEEGLDALTLAAVADRVGVRTPSLYKHVDGLPALREALAVRATTQLTEALRDAVLGRSGDDALRALMHAYRDFVVEHPPRYALVPVTPVASGTALGRAAEGLVAVVVAVLRGYDLDQEQAIHATRCLRSAVHGFASLEAAGGFGLPYDLDTTYEVLVEVVATGLAGSATRLS